MIRFEITSSLDYRIKLHEIGIETRPRIAFDGAERRSVSFFFSNVLFVAFDRNGRKE